MVAEQSWQSTAAILPKGKAWPHKVKRLLFALYVWLISLKSPSATTSTSLNSTRASQMFLSVIHQNLSGTHWYQVCPNDSEIDCRWAAGRWLGLCHRHPIVGTESHRHRRLPPASLPCKLCPLLLESNSNKGLYQYTLRRAYFSNTTGGEDFDFGLDRSNHTAHCFEYLRQSIICSADSTLEPAENRQTGFLGWGFKRSCSNFEELKDWAEKWKAFELHGFLANPRHQHL